ncbi:hypothetical protein [Rhizobium leguminosarum]|jgi:hypothetical protein|uniref:hypothetical protein n=1 Tax=Rhizobium leguminosarum TaxID=384 RepID=UPI001C91A56D|nr:hypothetical protein [Rhizobium leguminosarum]MBY3043639.1 hypothetical protein [Rhizobium leguminosarum]
MSIIVERYDTGTMSGGPWKSLLLLGIPCRMACAACAAGFPEIDGDEDQPSRRERETMSLPITTGLLEQANALPCQCIKDCTEERGERRRAAYLSSTHIAALL